jgi:hypothetical protein
MGDVCRVEVGGWTHTVSRSRLVCVDVVYESRPVPRARDAGTAR